MKNIILSSLILASSYSTFAQKNNFVKAKKICKTESIYSSAKSVNKFKDNLTVTIKLNTYTDGKITEKSDFNYTEGITHETKIVKLSKTRAFSISITKAIMNSEKYYLYSIAFYKREQGCWKAQGYSTWTKFNLGVVSSGAGLGYQGTDDYIFINGEIKIN